MKLFWIVMAVIGGGLILLIANGSSGMLGMSNDVAGRALYLGVWALVLAAGILGSGRRLGDIARSLGIWILVILVLVAGYQYRYELQVSPTASRSAWCPAVRSRSGMAATRS